MAEEIFSGYGVPAGPRALWTHDAQSDRKHQKLLECVLTGNSKLYLGKVYTEDQLANLAKKKWKTF